MTEQEWLDLKPGDWVLWLGDSHVLPALCKIIDARPALFPNRGRPIYVVQILRSSAYTGYGTITYPPDYQKHEPSELLLLLVEDNE